MFTKSKIIQNLLIVCFVCFLLTVMCGIMYHGFNKPNKFEVHTKIMQDFLQAVDSTNTSQPKVKIHDIGGEN
jgi:hypothetical protein